MYAPHVPATSRRCVGADTSESRGGAARITITSPSPSATRAMSSPGREATTAPPRSARTIASRPSRTWRPNPHVWPSHPSRTPPAAPRALTVERYQAAVAELSPNSSWRTGSAAAAPPICAAATTPAPMRPATAPQEVRPRSRRPGAGSPGRPDDAPSAAPSVVRTGSLSPIRMPSSLQGARTTRRIRQMTRTPRHPTHAERPQRPVQGDGWLCAAAQPPLYAARDRMIVLPLPARWRTTSRTRGASTDSGARPSRPDRPASRPPATR
jgi:hypothetical protein